jgi:hypothetical protein
MCTYTTNTAKIESSYHYIIMFIRSSSFLLPTRLMYNT